MDFVLKMMECVLKMMDFAELRLQVPKPKGDVTMDVVAQSESDRYVRLIQNRMISYLKKYKMLYLRKMMILQCERRSWVRFDLKRVVFSVEN